MKKESILLLSFTFLFVIGVLFIYILFIPSMAHFLKEMYPTVMIYSILTYVMLYATIVPLGLGCYYFIRILIFVFRFGKVDLVLEKWMIGIIKSGIGFSVIFTFSLPLFYLVADIEDAPGILLLACIVAAIGLVSSTFVSFIRKLVFHSHPEVK